MASTKTVAALNIKPTSNTKITKKESKTDISKSQTESKIKVSNDKLDINEKIMFDNFVL